MSRKTTSIKGVEVDFDLFEVKRQIADKPQSIEAKEREQFVFSKRRRGSKRTVTKMLKDQQENAASVRESMRTQNAATPEPSPTKPKTVAEKIKVKRRIIKKNTK